MSSSLGASPAHTTPPDELPELPLELDVLLEEELLTPDDDELPTPEDELLAPDEEGAPDDELFP